MEMAELVTYAGEKYQIHEEHKWADFPGFSVLCHPKTNKWVALLMRSRDVGSGRVVERCDLKCGREGLEAIPWSFLGPPVRMVGDAWISVSFDGRTERSVVCRLFDRAIQLNAPHGYTVILEPLAAGAGESYYETALPFSGGGRLPQAERIPDKIRKMQELYEYGHASDTARAENFYRQAVFMQDYEDDVPWRGPFVRYFSTYHDMSASQLRGYFTWRTGVRRGIFRPIDASAAYIYLYELLNGVGTASPEDVLQKLGAFEKGYLDTGMGDDRMRSNLKRWMLEYAVLYNLPPELVQPAGSDMMENDRALSVLKKPDSYTDEQVFAALCTFGVKRTADSPVITLNPERGMHLMSEAWRTAAGFQRGGKDLFALCFGKKVRRRWYPLANAVYHWRPSQKTQEDREYRLSDVRSYELRDGIWYVSAYEKLLFDRNRFRGFLHEADARFRRYLKTGRYLKENEGNEWAVPFIDAVIGEDRRLEEEAARPKITIDFSGLEKIRRDAEGTRDSLLTEEERQEMAGGEKPEAAEGQSERPPEGGEAEQLRTRPEEAGETDRLRTRPEEAGETEDPHLQILRALLLGEDPSALLREYHLMPSIAADSINEMLFDEIGDNVVSCEDDVLTLVEDYREDLEELLEDEAWCP